MQIERPQQVTAAIEKLLTQGTVEELKSKEGQFLRLFFTADEVARSMGLPMGDPPDFDGVTCALCRGDYRFGSCSKCHGTFDNLDHNGAAVIAERAQKAQEAKKKDIGAVKMFFDRMLGRDASY